MAPYFQGQYIRSTEAIWQLFKYSTHEKFLSVEELAVHLFGK